MATTDSDGSAFPVSAVEGERVAFRLADANHELSGVRLWQQLGLEDDSLEFTAVDGGWELRIPRPPVLRMEYLFAAHGDDGAVTTGVDPTNPLRVKGPFGEHSVLELPGYAVPKWFNAETTESRLEPLQVTGTPVGEVVVQVWSPGDSASTDELPLLLSHDGPEFASYAGLTRFVGALIAAGSLPRLRLALLSPGDRNVWYAANDDYASALVDHVLPTCRAAYACAPDVVLMGTSLGALCAFHAEWTHPGTFSGLFLQSGSFFTLKTDPQEQGFSGFGAVSAFVDQVLIAADATSTPAIGMTCGATEENVHNNRVFAAKLESLDYGVGYEETPDVHNFTGWRDALDPHLADLLRRVWRSADAP